MSEYQSPGVYVEEVQSGSKSVEGVSTSTAGFLGQTERGPVEPRLVTNYAEFERLYGASPKSSDLDAAVDGFFKNGGSRCFIGRVSGADIDDVATGILADDEGNEIAEVEANGPGQWGESVAVIVEDSQYPNQFDITVRYWSGDLEAVSKPHGDRPDPSPDVEEVYDGLSADPEASNFYEKQLESSVLVDIEYKDDGTPVDGLTWLHRDSHPTAYSDGGLVETDEEETVVHIPEDLDELEQESLEGIAEPLEIEIDEDADKDDLVVELEEVREGERDVDVEIVTEKPEADGEVTLKDYEGVNKPGLRTGLAGFKAIDEISMVCAPDENDIDGLTDSIVAHCENMGDRFAILQSPQNPGPVSEMETPVDSSYAAYYYPWVNVLDPVTNREKLVPPGGHIAGIYSRTDQEHGVHKAPANETLRGIVGLQHNITKGEQDVLNPKGINCIRSFQGRGIRVWGARTTSSDPEWKYLNVRRLFLFIEQSIQEGTQWAVFEPNEQDTWGRIRQSVTNFLRTVWRNGGLQGQSEDDAFYVKCGEETMSEDDIDNGRLIVEIGVAPVKPAEFVIFRISQDTEQA
ncbi:phage tail sheath family protein [Halogeometricum borinquense]|uniref:Phage tail sheath family protein n=1 Tax=Halogeometricum borinquense TaxID=60847 RepID=A0A6C0UT46_9EURY|nr:phage tail sheath family protein [Halogeometricum borinquense]QIB76118.1 phage tail sheath family protein [Halogeometricum borinquense]